MHKKIPCCTIDSADQEKVERSRASQPDEEVLQQLSELFKAMGEVSRLRILSALAMEELCVCELMRVLDMKQSAVSQQLRVLKAHRLVKYRKAGRSVYYRLDDQHVENLWLMGMEDIEEKR